ncbi:hypothetical protein LTR16_012112, partial [Cryomyces antarcticus]
TVEGGSVVVGGRCVVIKVTLVTVGRGAVVVWVVVLVAPLLSSARREATIAAAGADEAIEEDVDNVDDIVLLEGTTVPAIVVCVERLTEGSAEVTWSLSMVVVSVSVIVMKGAEPNTMFGETLMVGGCATAKYPCVDGASKPIGTDLYKPITV